MSVQALVNIVLALISCRSSGFCHFSTQRVDCRGYLHVRISRNSAQIVRTPVSSLGRRLVRKLVFSCVGLRVFFLVFVISLHVSMVIAWSSSFEVAGIWSWVIQMWVVEQVTVIRLFIVRIVHLSFRLLLSDLPLSQHSFDVVDDLQS